MSPRGTRTTSCSRADAQHRFREASAFLDAARAADQARGPQWRTVTVSNAVRAGIAAADAICCAKLGQRSSSSEHRDALTLLGTVAPEGTDGAKALRTLLDLKGKADYLPVSPSTTESQMALRRATWLVETAERVIRS